MYQNCEYGVPAAMDFTLELRAGHHLVRNME